MKKESKHLALDELCILVDLPRRTVRFYMQHGLVDRPNGAGRGAHYSARHVDQLLTVKKWKQAGLSLQRIRELVEDEEISVPLPIVRPGQVNVWSRVHIADGLELHIEPSRTGLDPEQVRSLIKSVMASYEQIRQKE